MEEKDTEFEAVAAEIEAQKTEVVESLAADSTAEMPAADAGTQAESQPETEPETQPETESKEKKRRIPPIAWVAGHKAVAGAVAAALVLGAIGIGIMAMPAGAADEPAREPVKTARTGGEAKPAQKAQPTPAARAQEDKAEAEEAVELETAAAENPAAENAAAPAEAPAEEQKAQEEKPAASSGSSSAPKASSGGGSNSSSGSNPATAPKQESKPAHEHSWTDVTEQVWVPNMVTVTDQAAWDEPVYEDVIYCGCGAVYTSSDAYSAHAKESALAGESGHNYNVKSKQVDTIHHDAVTHQEDQGHYETRVVGQKCSCGATK